MPTFAALRICTSDVLECRDFFSQFFEVAPLEDTPGFVAFDIEGTRLEIVLADEKSPVSLGGSVGYWLVEDFETSLTKAQYLGAQLYRGPLRVEEIQRVIVQLKDPSGAVFGLEAPF